MILPRRKLARAKRHPILNAVFTGGMMLSALAGPALADEPAATSTTVPEAEEATTASMTAAEPHWAFIRGSYGMNGTRVFDGDTGKMKGLVDTSARSDLAIDPNGKYYYVAESLWTEGDRGDRHDMVTIYDSLTLARLGKIIMPGRLIVGNRKQNFIVSNDGKLGYIYNMQPSSSVNVVDLVKRKFVKTIELPGCASLFPTTDGFSALCSDGSLATVTVAGAKSTVKHSATFFSASEDPIFDNGVVDRAKSEAVFLTYTGLVYSVKLGGEPQIGAPWSIQQAAGLRKGDTAPLDVNWFPGGRQPMALHRPSGHLYVLMHVGEYWTQKEEGTEVWVFDMATHKLLGRHALPEAAANIEVTQDEKQLVFVNEAKGKTWVLDGATFEEKRNIEHAGGGVISVIEPR
jgi:methylamine dehydrogenase heavy chain